MVIDTTWVPILAAVGLGLFLLSVLMLGICYWYRRRRRIRREIRNKVKEKYRPLLFDWIGGDNPSLPQPEKTVEWIHLISLWNDLYEKVGSSEHDRLRRAAEELDLKTKARQLLESNAVAQQITGVITLGHLEAQKCVDQIRRLTESSATILKMQSIKALAILEPEEALNKIFDDLVTNPNQSPNYYQGFCRSIDVDTLTEVTFDRLQMVNPEDRPRILPFLSFAQNEPARQYLHDELPMADNPETLSAGLKVLRKIGEPSDQDLVVEFLSHSVDFVRIQAARTLGAIGSSEAIDPLIDALPDSNWWVRYRAAESLVKMPSTSVDDLKDILTKVSGTDAKQALRSAISEVGAT